MHDAYRCEVCQATRDTVVDGSFYDAAERYLQGASGRTATIKRYPAGHLVVPDMSAALGLWFDTLHVHGGAIDGETA